MTGLSWSTFRERWQLFLGALVAVALGVALAQASLLTLLAAASPTIPPGLPDREELMVRDAYSGAVSLAAMIMAITTFVAVFVVGSTFAFTVAQRRRDMALLRLVGASRQQVSRLLLGEALLLGLLGTALGVVLGLLVVRVETWMFHHFDFVPVGFAAPWHGWVLSVSLAVGVGISLLGSFAASRRASRVRPLDALRDVGESDRVMTASRWVIGGLASAVAIALMIGTATAQGNAAMDLAIPACLVSVVALTSLSPLVAPAVGRLLEVGSRRLFPRSRVAELIHANLRDGVRRTASTAAPIILLVGLVVGLAGSVGVIDAGRQVELTRTLAADLVVSSTDALGDRLAGAEGVRTVSEEDPLIIEALDNDPDGASFEPVEAVAVDPEVYPVMHGVEVASGDWGALEGEAAALGESFASRFDLAVGDVERARVDGVTRDLEVVAILPVTMTGSDVLLPLTMAPVDTERLYLVETSGLGRAALGAELTRGESAPGTTVSTVEEWIGATTAARRQVSQNLILTILGLATIYIVIAVINAVVIAAGDRRVEFATARLTGLSRGLVVRTALWESMTVVLIGVLLGMAAAAATLVGVAAGVSSIVGTTVFSTPWALVAATVLGSTVVVAVTSVLTALGATRQPAIEVARARE